MNKIITCFLGGVMLLLLSGCATRSYEVPDQGIIPRDMVTASFGLDPVWWHAYGDEQLAGLVSLALSRNIDYAKTAINVNRALYQARKLGSDLVPDFSASTTGGSTTNTVTGEATRSWSGGLSLSYELDLWGKLRNSISAQEWELRATSEDREAARLALINNVIRTYYNLMYLHQAQEITRQGIDFYENLQAITEEKHRVGKVDGLEPITARQSLLAEKSNLLDLENQQKTGEQTLRDLLNLRPDEPFSLEYRDMLAIRNPGVDLDVPVAALGLRPDVHAAEYRLQRAFSSLESQKASLYPSVTIGGTLNVSSSEFNYLFQTPMAGGTIRLNFPFLQWNELRWDTRTAEAGLEEAELNFIQAVTTALNEVDTYYFAYRNSLSQLDNIIAKYEADAEITLYRERRYDAGVDELSDWLQARNTENNSRLAVLRAKYDVIENENAVYQAMGGRLMER